MPSLSPSLIELDTHAMEQAMWEIPAHKQRWVSKHITGQFAYGKNMYRQGQWTLAQCPRCNAEMEDKQHILQCPAPGARQ